MWLQGSSKEFRSCRDILGHSTVISSPSETFPVVTGHFYLFRANSSHFRPLLLISISNRLTFTSLLHRYGFNSDGHDRVFERITALKQQASPDLVLGVNLGKNKTTENAYEDYVDGINKFSSVADYFVVNVSSPNTVGLRDLQQAENLEILLKNIVAARDALIATDRKPILLKLSPDLDDASVKDVVKVISKKGCKIDGLIISNTTISRAESLQSGAKSETGGLSGAPVKDASTTLIAKVYKLTKGQVPIVGVGGVFSGQDAYEKITAGSSAVQLYTSLIYHGPPVVSKIKKELDAILEQNGFESVEKARGTQADTFAKR